MPTLGNMAKHWQETMFPQQCFLVCPGLNTNPIPNTNSNLALLQFVSKPFFFFKKKVLTKCHSEVSANQAFSQKGVQASWDAPRTKSGRLWTPKLWGEREIIFIDSLSILTYPKRNSFNSHYYYTFDILINLMVYLAE